MPNVLKPKLEVAAALIRDKDRFIICQRKEDDVFGLYWEFPGGKREDNESLEECIKREIKEELGLKIEVEKLIGIFEDENDRCKITVYLFLTKIVEGQPLKLECRDYRFVKIEELPSFSLAPVDKKIADYLQKIEV